MRPVRKRTSKRVGNDTVTVDSVSPLASEAPPSCARAFVANAAPPVAKTLAEVFATAADAANDEWRLTDERIREITEGVGGPVKAVEVAAAIFELRLNRSDDVTVCPNCSERRTHGIDSLCVRCRYDENDFAAAADMLRQALYASGARPEEVRSAAANFWRLASAFLESLKRGRVARRRMRRGNAIDAARKARGLS